MNKQLAYKPHPKAAAEPATTAARHAEPAEASVQNANPSDTGSDSTNQAKPSKQADNDNRQDGKRQWAQQNKSRYVIDPDEAENEYRRTRELVAKSAPPHVGVTSEPKKTPLEAQLLLLYFPIRYGPRSFFKSGFDTGVPESVRKYFFLSNAIRDGLFGADRYIGKIEKLLQDNQPMLKEIFPVSSPIPDSNEVFKEQIKSYHDTKGNAVGRDFRNQLKNLLRLWDGGDLVDNTARAFVKEMHRANVTLGSIPAGSAARKNIIKKMNELMFETMYDTSIGVGSMLYTSFVQKNIAQDIESLYREAVAYETGKPIESITRDDISQSDNQIIQSTMNNFSWKKAFRYGLTAVPFLKLVPALRPYQWGEAAIAGWAFMVARDIWGRQPTMLENFRSFVNDKLNPLYGISDQITTADIINIYQQYAYRFAQESAFKSVASNDVDANLMWARSEKVFTRIAELMNESYNYKHATSSENPVAQADFTLPKFIYLLGHGLIDARKPEWSMAFVEIANRYDMNALRDAEKAFKSGANIEEVLSRYPVDLNPSQHYNGISREIVLPKDRAEKPVNDPVNEKEKPEQPQPAQTDTPTKEPASPPKGEAQHNPPIGVSDTSQTPANQPKTAITTKGLAPDTIGKVAHNELATSLNG